MRSLVAVAASALVAAHGHGKHHKHVKLSHHDAEFAPRGSSLSVEADARVSFTAGLYLFWVLWFRTMRSTFLSLNSQIFRKSRLPSI